MASPHFEVYVDQDGDHRWRLRAANGEIVADSAEGYTERRECYASIYRLKDLIGGEMEAAELPIQEIVVRLPGDQTR